MWLLQIYMDRVIWEVYEKAQGRGIKMIDLNEGRLFILHLLFADDKALMWLSQLNSYDA